MESLKSRCSDFLCTKITAESFSKLLLLSHKLDAKVLKQKCLKYFEDHCKEIVKSDDWDSIMSANLELMPVLMKIITLKL